MTMTPMATLADKIAIETRSPWADCAPHDTLYEFLSDTAARNGAGKAVTFQLTSGPGDRAETLTWAELHAGVSRAANMFRDLGIGEGDTVAYLLPNCNETVLTLLGGAVAGIVNPINPLLEPEQIAGLLRETGAKVLVTLKAFPRADVAAKAAAALALAPSVETVLEVDLNRYLAPPKSWLVPFLRPKTPGAHQARVLDFHRTIARYRGDALDFEDSAGDRIAAYFHTGGTTGMPKMAQHAYSGMIYNGWLGRELLFTEDDTLICPLPLFHVFAAYPVLMSVIASGAHVVFPTPAGYRGDGVFDNFWKLVERWGVTFVITVPTALAALMQRPVDADISTLKLAFSGSSPLPVELYNKFESATGVTIVEGYGLTEATCLVSCNPPVGTKKVGSIGIPFPYTDVRILDCAADGAVERECAVNEVGEICVANPGVRAGETYMEAARNAGLSVDGTWLRTGDLGRVDEDGYLWITGRAKDIIIRGGHNIDPALIEEALSGHRDVALVGAIGQPDARAGEIPCAYVELVGGGTATPDELLDFARAHVTERAAVPHYVEIVETLPKSAVGKVLKNELRKSAIARIYADALAEAGIAAEVAAVIEDKKLGLVAELRAADRAGVEEAVGHCLGRFTRPWRWAD
jgi:fatty-acyl-CoA synthase